MDLHLEAALVRGLDEPLDRQPVLRRLDDRLARVIARRASVALRHEDAAIVRVDHDRVEDVSLARGDVPVRVLQLGDLDHRLGDARAELQERHVVAELDDLAGDLLADLEAPASRRASGGREHVREGALVRHGELGRGRRLGHVRRLPALGVGAARVARPFAALAAVATPLRAIPARRAAPRAGAAGRRGTTCAAGPVLGDALPERPGVVRLRRGLEPLLLRRLDSSRRAWAASRGPCGSPPGPEIRGFFSSDMAGVL